MAQTDLGIDLSCTSGLDATFQLVTGARVVSEAIVRRLTTKRGTLFYAPDYGSDVRDLLLAKMDQRRLDAARATIKAEVLKDERVESATVSLSFNPREERLSIRVEGAIAEGPFAFTLDATLGSVSVTSSSPPVSVPLSEPEVSPGTLDLTPLFA